MIRGDGSQRGRGLGGMSQRAARPRSAAPGGFEPVRTSDDDRRLRIRLRTKTPAASSPACWRYRPTEHVARKNRGFALRAIKGKGFGICATRDFAKGKRVPMGRDALVCRAEGESSADVWARTPHDDKLAFLALANQTDLPTSVRRTAIGAEAVEASIEEVCGPVGPVLLVLLVLTEATDSVT